MTLPIVHDTAESSSTPPVSLRRPNDSARRILLVDDNDDAAEMLRVALEDAGHIVAIAGSGPEALERAAQFRPEVGVLDIGLPGIDGYELARRLRRMHPAVRLVALTGYGQNSDIEAATRAGFDAHFAKPVPIASLLDALTGCRRGVDR